MIYLEVLVRLLKKKDLIIRHGDWRDESYNFLEFEPTV